jgi:hypothetical protein
MIIVRVCAHAIAVAAIALALAVLSRNLVEPGSSRRPEVVGAIEVVVERATAPRRRFVRTRPDDAPVAMAAPVVERRGRSIEAPGLWTYDELGRIVFRTREQLERCVSARKLRVEGADCPNSRDRRAMISRDSEE